MKAVKQFALLCMVAGLFAMAATPAMAQGEEATEEATVAAPQSWGYGFGKGIGTGLTIVGAGLGISAIGAKAVESMARQPEVAGQIQTAMIISAALIEGATFFALVVCFLIQP